VAVAKDFRGMGVASSLIDDFIVLAKEKKLAFITLEVRASNTGAILLYEQKGFSKVGERKRYYENTEDALLMTKFFDTEG
jgi:ribosomal-protein-alanine N-acetyltransferase